MRIETFEQLINFGAGRQFSVSKAHQRKARKSLAPIMKKGLQLFLLIIFNLTLIVLGFYIYIKTDPLIHKTIQNYFFSDLLLILAIILTIVLIAYSQKFIKYGVGTVFLLYFSIVFIVYF